MLRKLTIAVAGTAAAIGIAFAPAAQASPSTSTDASGGANTHITGSPLDRLQNSDPAWQNVTSRISGFGVVLKQLVDSLLHFGSSDVWQRLGATVGVVTHPGSAANPAQISSHGLPGTAP